MERPITVDELRRMSSDNMVRLEDLFRKLFPSVTAFKNLQAHFTPQLLLTLLQNRGSEVAVLDVEELRFLTSAMGELRNRLYSALTAGAGLGEGQAQEMLAHLQACSARLDKLYEKI